MILALKTKNSFIYRVLLPKSSNNRYSTNRVVQRIVLYFGYTVTHYVRQCCKMIAKTASTIEALISCCSFRIYKSGLNLLTILFKDMQNVFFFNLENRVISIYLRERVEAHNRASSFIIFFLLYIRPPQLAVE